MKYNALGNTHMRVSEISLGGATFSNIYGSFNEERGVALIKDCLKSGMNYLETGPWYGQGSSEQTFGKALRHIPRDSYFIGGKVGRYDLEPRRMFDFSAGRCRATVQNTLHLLGLEYLDIVQVHDLSFAPDINVILKETLPALEQTVSEGLACCIGLADYDIGLMKDITEETDVKISTVLSYAKSTMLDNRLQEHANFFKNKGIGVINAAVTGMGLLTNKGPRPWHPANAETKALCREAADYCRHRGVELARLSSWFTLNQPNIDTHVCGFYDIAELNSTLDVIKHGLTDKELAVLEEVKVRFFNREPMHWDGVEVIRHRNQMEVAI